MANEPQQPGLLDSLEDKAAASSDEFRAELPPEMHTWYDVNVGITKGAYGFTKSLVSGLIDLGTFSAKLQRGDTEAWKKVGESAWGVTKFVGKNFYYTYLASPQERMQYNKEMNEKLIGIWQQGKKAVQEDWAKAKAEGKEAELLSKWTTRGILEIAPFLIGVGEVNAAAKASKLSEATKVLEAAEVACPALDAEKAAALARQAEKAAALAKEAEAAKAAEAAAKASEAVVEEKRGQNVARWYKDSKGRTVRVEAELRESSAGLKRSAAEVKAQKAAATAGEEGDAGGHIIGHRFMGDQGPKNLFPQEANFNNSAYKTMENEIADWTKNGKQVNLTVEPRPPGATRPDAVAVKYTVTDPASGKVLYKNSQEFLNDTGQAFDRVPAGNMPAYK
jgi:hypothetical protein